MKKLLFLSLLAFATLLVSCNQNEPVNQEEDKTFEPYFLPLPDFVYEENFDTLGYNMEQHLYVSPLYVYQDTMYKTSINDIPYAEVWFRFDKEFRITQSNTSEGIAYVLQCNMPLDENEYLVPGVYKVLGGKQKIYSITTGVQFHYTDDSTIPNMFNVADKYYIVKANKIRNACCMIEKEDELYTIQFWIEFANGNRHYIVYKNCSTLGDIVVTQSLSTDSMLMCNKLLMYNKLWKSYYF